MTNLDQKKLRRAIGRAAAGYDKADFFCAEVRSRLFERLAFSTLLPDVVVDLGGGTGTADSDLKRLFPDALLLTLDWSENMLATVNERGGNAVCADSHRLPLADGSVDLVVSNMMLPSCVEPETVFREVRRVLRNPGLFLFSTLGPDTFKELRRAWSKVDNYTHVHDFADMHNVGDALVNAGFREPVMDVEMLTVNYSSADKLVADLRAVAAGNYSSTRLRGLTTPRRWDRVINELKAGKAPANRLSVSLEVVSGQAWAGAGDRGVRLENGEARFPISRLR